MRNTLLLFVLLIALGVSAQTPICKVDTTGWERITSIQLDNNENLHMECRSTYNTINSDSKLRIWFNTCIKDQKTYYDPKQQSMLDLANFNLVEVSYGFDTCDTKLNYNLYKDKNGEAILIINLFVPEDRCNSVTDIGFSFLVLKKDCSKRPRVCILQHQIENDLHVL